MRRSFKFLIISLVISITTLILLGALNFRTNSSYGMMDEIFLIYEFIILIISIILGLIVSKILTKKEKIKYFEIFILTSLIFFSSFFLFGFQIKVAELIGYENQEIWDVHKVEDLNPVIHQGIKDYAKIIFFILSLLGLLSFIIKMILKFGSYIIFLKQKNKTAE